MAGRSFNDQGGYEGETGPRINQNSNPQEGIDLRVDPASVPGMSDFQPGDKITMTVEFTLGDTDENGMADAQVTHATVEPMAAGAKRTRMIMGKKEPSTAGTAITRNDAADRGDGY